MVEIEFNFDQTTTKIQSKPEESFQDAINKFLQMSKLEPGSVNFLLNDKEINPNESVESHMSELDKQNQTMKLIVSKANKVDKDKEKIFTKSKDIICPVCNELCRIAIEDNMIKLFGCINGHEIEDIRFIDFPETQKINQSDIICNICKSKNKGNFQDDQFFRCLTCKLNLCLLCKPNHDSNHNIILYNQKNYICPVHNDSFIRYCSDCHKNFCFSCDEHKEHSTVFLGDIKPNIEQKKQILTELKTNIDQVNLTIKELIDKLNGFTEYINQFYEINKNILENYENNKRNFQILKNLDVINSNNKIFEILKNINIDNINGKVYDILNLYNNMYIKKNDKSIQEIKEDQINLKKNVMTIIYDSKHFETFEKNIIFGYKFVENNKNNCYLMINNKKTELTHVLIGELNRPKKLEIKLCETKTITDMSDMFNKSKYLISLPDFHEWETKNVVNMSGIFCGCKSLSSLPDISKWNTKNVKNMSLLFFDCKALSSLPDISKWDTKNVNNMSSLFHGCSSLKSLPDIAKWDMKNVKEMSHLFQECSSLKSLPDISKWDTKNLTNIQSLFDKCTSLTSLPNISCWDTKNVNNVKFMFSDCSSLLSLPDISKWDITNISSFYFMFGNCSSLLSIPDISKWDVKNVLDMSYMFEGCSSLKSFPDISSWVLNPNLKRENMFEGVKQKILPKKFRGCLIY